MDSHDQPLVNRVAASSLVTFNLEDHFPKSQVFQFDLEEYLFKGLILKEKDFRLAMKEYDWRALEGKMLAVYCSADAIVPTWAFMLVTSYATPFAQSVFFGTPEELIKHHYHTLIENLDLSHLKDRKVIVKGCSQKPVPISAYVELTRRLRPIAQSIMYGEPCSSVPIYKRPKQ